MKFNLLYDLSGTGFKTCETTRHLWFTLKIGTNNGTLTCIHKAKLLHGTLQYWTPVMKYNSMIVYSFQSSFTYVWLLESCNNLSNCYNDCNSSLNSFHHLLYSMTAVDNSYRKIENHAGWSHFKFMTRNLKWALSTARQFYYISLISLLSYFLHDYFTTLPFPHSQLITLLLNYWDGCN